jgi:hypothetical protein
VERHRIEQLRRSLVMAQDSTTPMTIEQATELLEAVQASEAELARLRYGLRRLLGEGPSDDH